MTLLAGRYARALFEVAESRGAVDAVAADLAAIDEILSDPELRSHASRADLSGGAARALLGRLGDGRHELVRNLFAVLQRRRRHTVVADLRVAFDALVRQARGEVHGRVETAGPIDDAQRGSIETLASKLAGRAVSLEFSDNPALLGGVRLQLGNTLYDGSVATRLGALRQRLLSSRIG
ncbi:MAG: ATP synthase F1 subunit delta [Planctomycetota bacterium]|nr:ATP synthase F1 subunit delta [Planctomycetota bacterium]